MVCYSDVTTRPWPIAATGEILLFRFIFSHHFFKITPGSLDGYASGPLESSCFSHPNPKIFMALDPLISHGCPNTPGEITRSFHKPVDSDWSGLKDLGLSVLNSARDEDT